MPVRSALARPFDFGRRSNAAIAGLTLLTAVVALVVYLNGRPVEVFLAPLHVFVTWAFVREIDPDHDWSALAAAVFAAGWALQTGNVTSLLAMGALTVAARLVVGTTGFRPAPIDLIVLTVGGSAIGFSVSGWVAGFGLAVAIYVDDRLAVLGRTAQAVAAGATALGVTVVAAFTGVFPPEATGLDPTMAIAAGVIGLLLVVRDPASPRSATDADSQLGLDQGRLHAGRSLAATLVFVLALLSGPDAAGLTTLLAAMLLAVVSNEVERARRSRQ